MSRWSIFALLCLFCLVVVGCSPFRGLIYTDVTEPGLGRPESLYSASTLVNYELDQGKGPGSKKGEGTVINILGLFAFGDASIAGAQR